MIYILSLVTSIKDYLEVVHKFIEYDSVNINYTELGSILTFFLISIKNCFVDFISFTWFPKENIWSLPIIIPEISSAMISEISVLDGYFHNAFNFLDTPVSYGMSTLVSSNEQNGLIACLEKLIIGGINSIFLFLPTSTAHIITLRRFVMQGLEAGYISGLGTIAGNVFWLASVILGLRFFVIPWLSLDIFRYVLGFILLVKYMWDSYNERKMVSNLDNAVRTGGAETSSTKWKIFLLNFLLALTEQTSIYPFISNISISPEASILENFSLTGLQGADGSNGTLFIAIHLAYLLGITLGSLSLLHLSCWFWENPAFKLYMWVISSFKVSTSFYYKALNFGFLYLTMLSAVCSIPYYGLDYTITNPLGYVSDDRLIQDKVVLETSFLGTKASDRNTRRNRGRHGRRERWKRRIRKYRTFDASLYDQGIYDLFTVEDLNYGFDRFWLRRKLRNHRVRFRFFPGPWMRSFKKQLAKPRLESYTGPRIEFFRILYEQVYHPSFHAYNTSNTNLSSTGSSTSTSSPSTSSSTSSSSSSSTSSVQENVQKGQKGTESIKTSQIGIGEAKVKSDLLNKPFSIYFKNNKKLTKSDSMLHLCSAPQGKVLCSSNGIQKSTIRKFIRKFDNRIKTSQLINLQAQTQNSNLNNKSSFLLNGKENKFLTYSNLKNGNKDGKSDILLNTFNLTALTSKKPKNYISTLDPLDEKQQDILVNNELLKDQNLKKPKTYLSKKENQMLQYRTLLTQNNANANALLSSNSKSLMLLHPLKFYLQQENAFKQKLRYYTPSVYRKFSVENNAPYFRVMMKRYFYNYKPSLRWERTMKAASLRKARRKSTRIPRKLQKGDLSSSVSLNSQMISSSNTNTNNNTIIPLEKASIQKSTYNYSVVSKRANRYRYQIYKDVLQHWYYSPFNRLLLKLDVDNFIKRQPNAHFLTAKEENLLHLRRFLLFEHYNTLRWYTNMEHYRSMKTKLNGGTKSFSSRAYNQQFFGTFKKIRHLFAITPSISTISNLSLALASPGQRPGDVSNTKAIPSVAKPIQTGNKNKPEDFIEDYKTQTNVLKFDQLLYNEYPNSKDNPLLNPLVIHEELLPDFINEGNNNLQLSNNSNNKESSKLNKLNGDLLSQSQQVVRQYLIQTRSIREEYIKKLLSENNYSKLTQFIYKGQKLRGNEPVTNQTLLNNQEKDYLLTSIEKNQIEKQLNDLISTNANANVNLTEQLYLTYLKNWKRRVNDQESLKNYLTRRLDKREKRKQKKEKQLLTKLKRLETWYSVTPMSSSVNSASASASASASSSSSSTSSSLSSNNSSTDLLTSGLQKSILEGMYVLNSVDQKTVSLNEKNLWKVLLLSKIKENPKINININNQSDNSSQNKSTVISNPNSFIRLQDITLRFNDLQNVQKIQLSNDIKTTVQAIRNIIKSSSSLEEKATPQLFAKKKDVKLNVGLYNSVKNKLTNYRNICLQKILKAKDTYLGFTKLTNLLKPIKRKSLKDWREKERVLGKQKRSRKEFKLLNKKNEFVSNYLDSNELELALQAPLRKKRESVSSANPEGVSKGSYSSPEEQGILNNKEKDNKLNPSSSTSSEQLYFTNSFKRKRSPQRRSRIRRNRGVFKKRTLTDLLRKDFVQFYKLYKEGDSTDVKAQYYKKFNENLYGTSVNTLINEKPRFSNLQSKLSSSLQNLPFGKSLGISNSSQSQGANNTFPLSQDGQETPLKQRKSKQRKERYWKQKRSKYSQKRRKYRKRRRYTIVKIRNLNKQFKRVKNIVKIQNWWWKQFVPSIQASNEALWQIERDKLIQQKLSQLSTSEILERDNLNNSSFNVLQIGNKDFKPLALPEAIRLIESNKVEQINKSLSFAPSSNNSANNSALPSLQVGESYPSVGEQQQQQQQQQQGQQGQEAFVYDKGVDQQKNSFNVVNKLYESLFINNKQNLSFNEFLLPNTSLPFYAGWDESLRKLIVTNRMLSRKDAGFTLYNNNLNTSQNDTNTILSTNNQLDQTDNLSEFTLAPLQGMNAATTLYWQIPFTTYDPDQFFALGMDGFSPIGWRKFLFRHSILKTWLGQRSSLSSLSNEKGEREGERNTLSTSTFAQPTIAKKEEGEQQRSLIVKTKSNIINDLSLFGLTNANPNTVTTNLFKQQKRAFATSRRLKKRYRRVKKHPRTPVWFPSGPLSNQVLPVHYIYVFYKRSRLPRDRYLKRRLLNVKNQNTTFINNFINSNKQINSSFNYDFTLRKRLKPKRKYHLKRDYYASNVIIPRRLKFMSINQTNTDLKIWRPLSSLKIHKPIADVVKEQQLLRRSALQKQRASKQPNIRVKQLRRRVQRQILRTVWRYRPRAGGFVWPGDYLKLELVKAPKLQSTITNDKNSQLNINSANTNITSGKKQKRKKKRNLVEWQIQPKKYLYQKHNLKVLKKKLQKAQRSVGSYSNTLNVLRNSI